MKMTVSSALRGFCYFMGGYRAVLKITIVNLLIVAVLRLVIEMSRLIFRTTYN